MDMADDTLFVDYHGLRNAAHEKGIGTGVIGIESHIQVTPFLLLEKLYDFLGLFSLVDRNQGDALSLQPVSCLHNFG